MWRDEKTEYLRKNRDYSRLLDGDDAEVQTPRSQNRGRSKEGQFRADDDDDDDVSPERQEYLNRRRRLKELERQKLTNGKNGLRGSSSRDEVPKPAEPSKDQGGSRSGGGTLPLSKEKNKMPYRRFGSFFGPSEPVVAKRIIEEARAREQAEIVAAREANAHREKKAEQKKSGGALPSGKSVRDSGPSRLPKPVDKCTQATEKARKLKEARDYSFLFDDSPLPGPKRAEIEGPASSNLREARHGTAPVKANDHPPRKLPVELPKITIRARRPDESTTPSRSFQSQSKSSEPSRSLPRHGSKNRFDSGRSDMQNLSIVDRSTKPLTSKISSAGPGRPDPGKEKFFEKAVRRELVAGSISNRNKSINGRLDPRKEKDSERALMRELVAGSTSNRNKSSNADRRPQPSPVVERRSSQTVDRRPTLVKERAFNKPLNRSPSRATERLPAQTTDRRPTLVKDREIVMAKASERGASIAQGSKRGAPTSATYRAAGVREEQRRQVLISQKLERKPTSKSALETSVSDYPRIRYSEEPGRGETRRKRAPSLSDDDDNSFIDDDDDPGNVSSMIHSIMGYNPNKYRGNDDFDDRSMEVGFRHIQAEERRSAREARFEDERELAMIEAEEREERLRKAKKKRKQVDR